VNAERLVVEVTLGLGPTVPREDVVEQLIPGPVRRLDAGERFHARRGEARLLAQFAPGRGEGVLAGLQSAGRRSTADAVGRLPPLLDEDDTTVVVAVGRGAGVVSARVVRRRGLGSRQRVDVDVDVDVGSNEREDHDSRRFGDVVVLGFRAVRQPDTVGQYLEGLAGV
jgi:hypothetical protein